jgi:Lanthionine synthetase C-like protein
MLYTPTAHEPLTEVPWDEQRVRAAIREIAREAEEALEPDAGWPPHPRDDEKERRFHTLYLGAAGVIWALESLQARGVVELARDYVPVLERLLEAERADPDFADDDHARSLLMGECGLLLVLELRAPRPERRKRLAELIAANADDPRRELMWGSPGTMLAARRLGLDDLWQESAERLRQRWDEDSGVWTQHLYGEPRRFLGPVHGFAGNVLALSAEPSEELHRRAAATVRRYAAVEDSLANWSPLAGEPLEHRGGIRVQYCHGAPGMVAALARIAAGDEEHERLLVAGGELTWHAGPLAKGANLCHGTAGNGYAFLALHERTGDERWLARARAFAMHALEQVERDRAEFGQGRYTLWTGDPGTAIYLADCLDGRGEFPSCP